MLQVSHLQHSDAGIHCTSCGQRFEVSSRALMQPHTLLEWKEGIAAQHTCKPRIDRRQRVKVWRSPTGEIELEAYFGNAVRRLMTA